MRGHEPRRRSVKPTNRRRSVYFLRLELLRSALRRLNPAGPPPTQTISYTSGRTFIFVPVVDPDVDSVRRDETGIEHVHEDIDPLHDVRVNRSSMFGMKNRLILTVCI